MKKMSIVILVKNDEKYISKCIESLLNQSISDIEIICINDGSTDKSFNILSKYSKKDKRISIFNNIDILRSKNIGLEKSNGKYLCFLNSCDFFASNALEKIYSLLDNNKLDVLYFDSILFDDDSNIKNLNEVLIDNYDDVFIKENICFGSDLFFKMRKKSNFKTTIFLQAFRNEFIKQNNIKFYDNIFQQDILFSILVTLFSKRSLSISDKLYMSRIKTKADLNVIDPLKQCFGYSKILMEIIPIVNNMNLTEEVYNIYVEYLKNLYLMSFDKVKMLSKNKLSQFIKELSYEDYLYYKIYFEPYFNLKLDFSIANLKIDDNFKFKSLFLNFKIIYKEKINDMFGNLRKHFSRFRHLIIKKPYISVIMPVYNCKDYLNEALDSLLDQTLKNIEIICIDDESTDGSYEVLKFYEKKDKRIHVLQQEHSNAGNARNLGISKSKGDFLLFLDSDDIFNRKLCSTAYNYGVRNKAEIVLFNARRYDSLTGKCKEMTNLLNKNIHLYKKVFSAKDIPNDLFQLTSSAPWSKLFSAKYVKKNKFYFQSCTNSNDVFFTRTTMSCSKRMVILDKALVDYRCNHGTNTQSKKHKEPLAFINAYLEVKKFLDKNGSYELYKKSFINVFLHEVVFNYNTTLTEDAKNKIIETVKNVCVNKFELNNIDIEDVYNYDDYYYFKKIINKEKIK